MQETVRKAGVRAVMQQLCRSPAEVRIFSYDGFHLILIVVRLLSS